MITEKLKKTLLQEKMPEFSDKFDFIKNALWALPKELKGKRNYSKVDSPYMWYILKALLATFEGDFENKVNVRFWDGCLWMVHAQIIETQKEVQLLFECAKKTLKQNGYIDITVEQQKYFIEGVFQYLSRYVAAGLKIPKWEGLSQ